MAAGGSSIVNTVHLSVRAMLSRYDTHLTLHFSSLLILTHLYIAILFRKLILINTVD